MKKTESVGLYFGDNTNLTGLAVQVPCTDVMPKAHASVWHA